jgi:hypothetical protein
MTTTTSHTMKRTTEASAPTESVPPSPLSKVRFGMVDAYSVDADRLMIKFSVVTGTGGPITGRMLIYAAADAPNFRSWVSMVMIAHQTERYLNVRYSTVILSPHPNPEVFTALELGVGNGALSFDDWPT